MLAVPVVDNIAIEKLVPYHQILVTFSYNTPGGTLLKPESGIDEVKSMYSFFSKYGNIVDLNLEFMPACIVITFTRHESILEILTRSK